LDISLSGSYHDRNAKSSNSQDAVTDA